MIVENLKFEWVKTGTNCDADQLELKCLGHQAKIYRSHDNKLWCSIVDYRGERGLESEAAAKTLSEEIIRDKILARFKKANADLNLFNASGLNFTAEERNKI